MSIYIGVLYKKVKKKCPYKRTFQFLYEYLRSLTLINKKLIRLLALTSFPFFSQNNALIQYAYPICSEDNDHNAL